MSEGVSASQSTTPHDALFRMAFSEPEVAIPQVKAMVPGGYHRWLELDGLAVEASAFVSQALRPQYGDMLYRIPLASDGKFLWFLVEHFSASQRFMPLRCLGYENEI